MSYFHFIPHLDLPREASGRISAQHPNAPVFVSPWWLLACCQNGALQDPSDFEPKYRQRLPAEPCRKKTKPNSTMTSRNTNNKQQLHGNLFHGCLFAFLRVSPPPGTVDFTTSELEALVASQNGRLLSSQLLDALKVDLSRNHNTAAHTNNKNVDATTPINKKKCFVICWGGGISGGTESVMMMHPLLAQVKRRELADIVEATPIWLQTCCTEQRIVPPQRLAILFQPTAWAIRSLSSLGQKPLQQPQQKSTSGEKQDPALLQKPAAVLRISVSGFSGSRRTAMIHLITVMGAIYDDSMRTSTTHLICRNPSGLKYQKAMEWKLHVVSIDWLYHVAQYGYKGKQHQQHQANGGAGTAASTATTSLSAVGCEDRFTLPNAPCPSKKP
jgi:twin BRCT domain